MLDPIDQQIVNILMEDSRTTNVKIAKKIKRSESTVRQRLTKLIAKGVLRKFTVIVDPNAFGVNTIAFVGVNTNSSKLLKVIKNLNKINEIVSISTTTGDYMILCEVWTKDGAHLSDVIDKMEEIDGVIEVLPSIIQEKYKE
ncbi:MAG: Lrp/AsnC family transcriptional regulator [Candidatus Heimdallarchaeota archaeon]